MDDLKYGTRNKRGDWRPDEALKYPPIFTWPLQPLGFLKWMFGFPGYLWPWNTLYLGVTVLVWYLLLPSTETTATLSAGWILFVLARNVAITLVFYGVLHAHFYIARNQGTTFKHNGHWPDKPNSAFLFNNQTKDNLFWTFVSGVPIWSAFEVLMLWAASNMYAPVLGSDIGPFYFVVMFLLIPVWRDVHFFVIHRAIHWPPLYNAIHKLHHNNVNPGPWSGLAMHPVEHVIYFSNVLIFFIVPFHPLHALFMLFHTALVPAQVHLGFDKIVVGDDTAIDAEEYSHYLHHKYFECNYSDGMIPLDKWFGTFHDGSPESEQRMLDRFKARNAHRANA